MRETVRCPQCGLIARADIPQHNFRMSDIEIDRRCSCELTRAQVREMQLAAYLAAGVDQRAGYRGELGNHFEED